MDIDKKARAKLKLQQPLCLTREPVEERMVASSAV